MKTQQIKAFFLGNFCADKPMTFKKAIEELYNEDEPSLSEKELRDLWQKLEDNFSEELKTMFTEDKDVRTFIENARDQLDLFLTALTLAGTSSESCRDEDMGELMDELEDTVEDFDDYLADDTASVEDGKDYKEFLLGTWADFVTAKASK